MNALLFSPVRPARRVAAFTLIELLTVIAIIGILAGILIPTVGKVKETANKAKTRTQFSQMSAAMESFKQEYGYYPSIATNGKVESDRFAPAMMGKRNFKGDTLATNATAKELRGNTKRISFYVPGASELTEAGAKPELVDAFGNTEIAVRVDTNSDGKIDKLDERNEGGSSVYPNNWISVKSFNTGKAFSPTANDTTLSTEGVRAGVVFYSAGKGEIAGDLVLSWK